MKFLADENIDRPVVEKLRQDFDVEYIEEVDKGAKDLEVIDRAREEDRIVLTFDRDFLDPEGSHPGIIKITRPDRYGLIVKMVKDLADSFTESDFEGIVVRASPSDYRE